jgi:hypothetical protein
MRRAAAQGAQFITGRPKASGDRALSLLVR